MSPAIDCANQTIARQCACWNAPARENTWHIRPTAPSRLILATPGPLVAITGFCGFETCRLAGFVQIQRYRVLMSCLPSIVCSWCNQPSVSGEKMEPGMAANGCTTADRLGQFYSGFSSHPSVWGRLREAATQPAPRYIRTLYPYMQNLAGSRIPRRPLPRSTEHDWGMGRVSPGPA